jgi:two-component sensor histidine kinase
MRYCPEHSRRAAVRSCAPHELATNAAKYGALSVRGGRVSIKCGVERGNGDSTFSFLWQETVGPPLSAPNHKGFGSTILVDGAKQFTSQVALNYESEGLRYEVRCPLSAIEAITSDAAGLR